LGLFLPVQPECTGIRYWRELSTNAETMCPMSEVIYEIVEHDGGWAYKVDGAFSEPFPTHAAALAAAQAAAAEQKVPGQTEEIEFEDEKGRWHTETARGSDRPDTHIKDKD
jgi:Uncharacterized protein conserved in bacteria (DUF2188)